jgi:hypothetical protein
VSFRPAWAAQRELFSQTTSKPKKKREEIKKKPHIILIAF